jgi:hypothetical protein
MAKQKLITAADRKKLLRNGALRSPSNKPVIKLFNPTGAATWLISEIDPENEDIMFGLCDLGFGSPEMGSVSLAEIMAVRGRFGLGIERDQWFSPKMTLVEYADKARDAGRIVLD